MGIAVPVTRCVTVAGTVLLLTFGLLLAAGSARADPGTATGFYMSMTVSDTTPAPGQTITVDFDYTVQSFDADNATEASIGFGRYYFDSSDVPALNAADLSLVPDSCTGDLSNCTYDATRDDPFAGDVPVGIEDEHLTGSAQFVVSSSATDGETIRFSGRHDTDFVGTGTEPIELTVTAPPGADLGVSLGASAGSFLSGSINYDAAITNHGPAAVSSATITTQLSSHATSIASSTCTFSTSTHQVSCPIGALANGATTHATFAAYYGVLTFGLPLNATATRMASAPADPNAANDSDGANCTVLTGLIIVC